MMGTTLCVGDLVGWIDLETWCYQLAGQPPEVRRCAHAVVIGTDLERRIACGVIPGLSLRGRALAGGPLELDVPICNLCHRKLHPRND